MLVETNGMPTNRSCCLELLLGAFFAAAFFAGAFFAGAFFAAFVVDFLAMVVLMGATVTRPMHQVNQDVIATNKSSPVDGRKLSLLPLK